MRAHRSTEREWAPEAEAPRPAPGPGDVVVRAGAGGLGRGDLHVFHHRSPTALPWIWTLPLTLGQEVGAWEAEPSPESRVSSRGNAVLVDCRSFRTGSALRARR